MHILDTTAPRFGLPRNLWIPIAAASVEDIEKYVGRVVQSINGVGTTRINAVLVESLPLNIRVEPNVALWKSDLAELARKRLHPAKQVWVHVDYNAYRQAWVQFGMPPVPNSFLDHVQNRKAMRLRVSSHPYLRLCPVDSAVNTSAGHWAGGEGMEREFLSTHSVPPSLNRIIYADPMDLTKILNIAPGTKVLNGVRDTQRLFYP
jgi:hypothetical protein